MPSKRRNGNRVRSQQAVHLVMDHQFSRPDVSASYIDTHCHLFTTLNMLRSKTKDFSTLPEERIDLMAKLFFPKNIKAVVDIHCELPITNLHEKAVSFTDWPEGFQYYFSVGAHPHTAMLYSDIVHSQFLEIMKHPRCVAWGECGLDYFKNPPQTHETQRKVFARQLQAAVSLRKPIVVHTRDADEDTMSVIEANVPRHHRMHIHCFTSSPKMAEWILKEYPNSYIGITGVISYSGLNHVTDLIRDGKLPLERILLETDSPFMTPANATEWVRGKHQNNPEKSRRRLAICHSGMIPFTAELVAKWINEGRESRGVLEREGIDSVLEATAKNVEKMYGIPIL